MAENIQTIGSGGGRDQRGLVTLNIVIDKVRLENVLSVQPQGNLGLVEIGRTFQQRQDQYFRVTISLQGASASGNFPIGPEKATYEFVPAFSDRPIESHPYINWLFKNFGGQWNLDRTKVTFKPDYNPTTKQTETLAADSTSGDNVNQSVNPMFGTDTWELLGGTFRTRYCSFTLPTDLLSRIGKIVNSLPKGYPTPKGRNWLTLPVPWTFRGNVYDITEELRLSKPGGWDPATVALFTQT